MRSFLKKAKVAQFQLVHVVENDKFSLYVNCPAEVRDDIFNSILIQYVFTSTGKCT